MSAQVTPVRGKRLVLDSQKVGRLLAEATIRGKVDSLNSSVIDYAERCEAPLALDLHGKRFRDHPARKYAHGRGATLRVPCRRCAPCLKARSNRWAGRAINELQFWPRTWFGTMTLRPERQFVARVHAGVVVRRRRAEELEAMSPSAQFPHLVREISPELTKWLKRIRKESGARLRYLLVAEGHKSGDPHFHVLLHEVDGAVRKRTLEGQWGQGFSHWRLVEGSDGRAAWYVCKYLAKSALTRVRASAAYGQPVEALSRVSGRDASSCNGEAAQRRRNPPLKSNDEARLSPHLGGAASLRGVDGYQIDTSTELRDPLSGEMKGLLSSVHPLLAEVLARFPRAEEMSEKENLEFDLWLAFK